MVTEPVSVVMVQELTALLELAGTEVPLPVCDEPTSPALVVPSVVPDEEPAVTAEPDRDPETEPVNEPVTEPVKELDTEAEASVEVEPLFEVLALGRHWALMGSMRSVRRLTPVLSVQSGTLSATSTSSSMTQDSELQIVSTCSVVSAVESVVKSKPVADAQSETLPLPTMEVTSDVSH